MDNANTNESNENVNENDWVLINKTALQVRNNETVPLPEMQKDLSNKNRIIEISNSCIGVLCENIDSDDTSNDVSVITESDADASNQDFSTYQDENKIYKSENIVDKILHQGQQLQNDVTKSNAYAFSKNFISSLLDYNIRSDYWDNKNVSQLCEPNNNEVFNMVRYILFGCMIGIFLSHFTFWPTNDENIDIVGIKDLQTECHNIINTFKEVNATLNEIKVHILTENKLNKDYTWQLLKSINYPNKMNNKPIMESLNNGPHLLDHLQESLNVLSLLSNDMIYASNDLLKNKINKTLDVVDDTKIFYETLVSFNDSRQSMNVSAVVQFLQDAINKIHHTSRSLLTDLVKKLSNIMVNVHNKYNKMRHKLIKKLCYLKNVLPGDSKFLDQLTEKSQFLSNYDKYCSRKNASIKLNGKTSKKENTRTNENIKRQPEKTNDSISHTKLETGDTQTIDIEIYCDKVTNDHSQPTQTGQCTDETLNNNVDRITDEPNIRAASDYGKITADKTKVKGPKINNNFKSNDSTRKVFNTDKPIKEKYISPRIKTRIHAPKTDKDHYKHSSKDESADQDHHQIKSADWLFERSNERQKLRQASNAYSTKVPKDSKYEVNFNAAIDNMIQTFGKSIDKAMRFFKRKVEDILRRDVLKEK
ncbi:PREDICTED: uncharacterized protein LOC106741354 [Dinoponera quadriceps]|uniref:Uncharacterized protein LOC106741354 n=1 Tax=Dinoponera quadriceps TaxID=609295 RepID=A0A6P3WRK8_DINQU|nr:PREDICTED: uncharacterized protein LOC106741354 [Dinoponera quadriceps]